MWRSLHITAFDVMDQVHVTVHLREYDGTNIGTSTVAVERSSDVQGVGQPDEHQWIRDVLVAVLEDY